MGSEKNTEPKVRQRVRIRFSKQGDLRLIGHRDLLRLLERLFRRAKLRLGMSEGFHPKPRMSFPWALAVGIEGRDELMELELAERYTAEHLIELLNAHTVPGLKFLSVQIMPETDKIVRSQVNAVDYQIEVSSERHEETLRKVKWLMDQSAYEIERPRRSGTLDLRHYLEHLELIDGKLCFRLKVTRQANPGPRDVLTAIGLEDIETRPGSCLVRTKVHAVP
ncbi:MAG: TIGR03936 family radical SAM-associated protein [Planctomycetia bacterium]|jgi:radical SAM-linked protein